MAVNKRTRILYRTKDSQNTDRKLEVFEEDTTKDLNSTVKLYANTYSHITFDYEYKTSTFKYADVYVTNRFTMETVQKTKLSCESLYIPIMTPLTDDSDSPTSFIHTRYIQDVKITRVEVFLSMLDFMYGDIYVQFYDDSSPTEKEKYCAPIIVQFTNAPTVYVANVYKWRPNFTTTAVEDYDNIFTSSFGSRWQPGKVDIPDTGRTDVLTAGETTDCYNDFMSHDRLITNGYKAGGNEVSLSGHPVYMVEYRSFVPSAFSKEFGINNSPTVVSFSATNAGSGYLTSAVDNWQTMQNNKIDLRMYTKDNDTSFLKTDYQLTAAKLQNNTEKTIGGIKRVFVAHLTAASATRPDDAWFREHTRACADFVLTGIDPYWMSDDKV